MEIRYLSPADNKMAIGKIYVDSWKSAYVGIVPQDYLNSLDEEQWASKLDNPNRKTLLCIDSNKIIGTSSFGKSRNKQFETFGEIISIYLLPDYIGKGFGKLLMESVISELEKLGYKDVFLWVLEENIKARNFYQKFGFTQTNDFFDINIGGKALREIRYTYKIR